jgi:hypothetical protein
VLSNLKGYLSNSQSDGNEDPHDDNNKLGRQVATAEVESWEVFIHRDDKEIHLWALINYYILKL